MTATLAASTAILKTKYPDGIPPRECYEDNVALAMIPKATDFDGENYVVALQTETTQGASADFAIAQANLAQGTYKRFTVTRVSDYSLARVTGEAMKAAKGAGALVDLWDSEVKGATHTATRAAAIQLYRSGTGSRGSINSAVAATTITLGTLSDVTNFAVGMTIAATNGDGGALRTGGAAKAVISGIDRANGTLTFAANLSASITDVVNGDFIHRQGDNNAVITGFGKIVEGGAAPSALYGLTRTSDPVRLAGQSFSGLNMPMHEALIEGSARAAVEGGRPKHAFMHPRDAANMKKQLDAKVQYDRVDSSVAGISFSAMELEGDNGKIKILTDMNCPRNKCFLLELDSFKLHTLGPAPHILDYDTQQILRVTNADSYEVRIGMYGNVWCKKPVGNVQITSFGL